MTSTMSGVIRNTTGTAGLIKTGVGTLTLTAANTYNGDTTISAGTLSIGSGGATGSIANASGVTNNAAMIINRSNDLTAGYAIGGTGTLDKNEQDSYPHR